MPELPEITLYLDAFDRRVVGRRLESIRVRSPSFLRTVEPAISAAAGRRIRGTRRLGKRIVWEAERELFLVVHLMLTGRFHARKPGAAHTDEILHAARLSPLQLTTHLSDDEIERPREAATTHLRRWIELLREEVGEGFPERIRSAHPAMAVHGRFGEPCPTCGDPIQRMVYAHRETNYCPGCQTGGRLLADRGLSRLLGDHGPPSLADMQARLDEGGSAEP